MRFLIPIIFTLFTGYLTAQNTSYVCPGGDWPSLTATCSDGTPPYTVTWTSPTGTTSTGVTKILNQAGVWQYQCVDSSDPSCPYGGTHTVIVEAEPSVTINATNACAGATQTVSATGVPAGYTLAWNFGSGAVPATSTTPFTNVVWNTNGTKTITLVITKTFSDPNIICTDPCTDTTTTTIAVTSISGSISCTP